MIRLQLILLFVLSGCPEKEHRRASPPHKRKDTIPHSVNLQWYVQKSESSSLLPSYDSLKALPSLTDENIEDTSFVYKGNKIFPILFYNQNKDLRFALISKRKSRTDTLYDDDIRILGPSFEFTDYNFDQHPDLLMRFYDIYIGEYLFLYDTLSGKYKEVKDYNDFQQSTIIDSLKQLRYSYQAGGCADMCWESNLFKIKHGRIVSYGKLEYGLEDCDTKGYYIYKRKGMPAYHKNMPFKNRDRAFEFNDNKRSWMERFWKSKIKELDLTDSSLIH